DSTAPSSIVHRPSSAEGPRPSSGAAYEFRPQQVEMAKAVASAFNKGHHLLVEAGTGTGKSIGYLLPAILYAMRTGERVIVSTNTINLQDQLFTKDLPLLHKILSDLLPFRAALL